MGLIKSGCLASVLVAGLGLFGVSARVQAEARKSMTLVRDGKPTAVIVISPDASQIIKDAVKELQVYIRKMSGATLPITTWSDNHTGNMILVGRMPAVNQLVPDLDRMDLAPDGMVIKSFSDQLVITGQSDGYKHKSGQLIDCGTPNAVYSFLATLGCRWYMPGEDGEVVPEKKTIVVPEMTVISKPSFAGRWIGGGATLEMGEKAYQDYERWAKRNRVNFNLYHQGHSLEGLCNPKEYFSKHPEWFPLINGQRYSGYSQVCLSNPQVVEVVARTLKGWLDRESSYRSYPVSQNDSWLWCECGPCRKLMGDKTFVYPPGMENMLEAEANKTYPNLANAYLSFVNKVAEEIGKSYPNCLITYYALYNIQGFPEVKPRENVMPVMCHIAPHNDAWRREVLKWEAVSKQLYYYGYTGHRNSFLRLRTQIDDIRWCNEHKGVAMYICMDEYSPINMVTLYLSAKGLWDTHSDSQKIMAEFYETFYGSAANPLRKFYETFDAATYEMMLKWDSGFEYPDPLTPAVVTQCRKYLQEGLSQADQPVVKRRIELLLKFWKGVDLQVKAQEAITKWRKDKTEANNKAAVKAWLNTIAYMTSVSKDFYLQERINPMRNRILKELASYEASGRTIFDFPPQWDFKIDPKDVGLKEEWFKKAVDPSWKKIRTDQDWTSQGYRYYGPAWYRAVFSLPTNIPPGTTLMLAFGAVDGYADFYLDGVKIGEQKEDVEIMWDKPFGIPLPPDIAPNPALLDKPDQFKEHHLTIRVKKDAGAAGISKPVTIVKKGQVPEASYWVGK